MNGPVRGGLVLFGGDGWYKDFTWVNKKVHRYCIRYNKDQVTRQGSGKEMDVY